MEQKLAEFRARRQAEHAAKKDQCGSLQSKTETVTDSAAQTDTSADSQQTENTRTSSHSSQSKDQSDWLLDSALGRWLSSRKLVLSNITSWKCCFGWFSLVCLQNWSLVSPSSSSPSSTGSMKDSVAQRPVSLENSALILSSIQTVSLCWALSLQSSWKARWVTDLWLTDEMLGTFISNNQFKNVNFIQAYTGTYNSNFNLLFQSNTLLLTVLFLFLFSLKQFNGVTDTVHHLVVEEGYTTTNTVV